MKKPLVAAFDLLSCLLLIFIILTLLQKPDPPAIRTLGTFAVVITWADGSENDIDLYVMSPAGDICYFGNTDAGILHLEYDDLGAFITTGVAARGERIIIRGVEAGEYIVNIHGYRMTGRVPEVVSVKLYRIAGADTLLHETTVRVVDTGDEITAFRFVVKPSGEVGNYSTLQAADMVQNGW